MTLRGPRGAKVEPYSLKVNGRTLHTYRAARRGALNLPRGDDHGELVAAARGWRYYIQTGYVRIRR